MPKHRKGRRNHKPTFEWGDKNYHTPFGERDQPYAPCVPIVEGSYRGARRMIVQRGRTPSHITATVESKRGGWHRGLTLLDGKEVYVGAWERSRQAALSYARDCMGVVRAGLDD